MLALQGGVDVQNQVDTGGSQQGHTLIMALSWIHRVHTDRIDSKLLEQEDITTALVSVGEGVSSLLDVCRATRLVINTFDLSNHQ